MGWEQVDPAAARVQWLKAELERVNRGDPTMSNEDRLQRADRLEQLLSAEDVAAVDADRRTILEERLVESLCHVELGDPGDWQKQSDELGAVLAVDVAAQVADLSPNRKSPT